MTEIEYLRANARDMGWAADESFTDSELEALHKAWITMPGGVQ